MTSTTDTSGAPLLPPPRPRDTEVTMRSLAMKPRNFLVEVGSIARFGIRVGTDLPHLIRNYPSEILRQAGIIILSSGFVIWGMMFIIGNICGVESHYLLQQVGAPLYSGVFASYCGMREVGPFVWGYILAAKVGCGLVAEIGSMRIADEIDAMEVMGLKSSSYLVGSRLAASVLAMPFLYVVGIGLVYLAEYLVVVEQLGGVSSGGYLYIFWLFQSPLDLLYSLAKAMTMGLVIVLVGCYYGYHASGGPVGVGRNTSQSMMVNLVLVHVVGLVGTALFWGFAPNAPIAN